MVGTLTPPTTLGGVPGHRDEARPPGVRPGGYGLSGLLGVGGGMFYVPGMNTLMNIPVRVATATSNFMIGMTATAGALVLPPLRPSGRRSRGACWLSESYG